MGRPSQFDMSSITLLVLGVLRRADAADLLKHMTPAMWCARPGATTTDVYWHTQLRLERVPTIDIQLLNLQFDRDTLFDRLPIQVDP